MTVVFLLTVLSLLAQPCFLFVWKVHRLGECPRSQAGHQIEEWHIPCLLLIALYSIKNEHIFTICILLMLWHSRQWQAAERAALSLIYQNPSKDSIKGKDLWSFHLERLAVPICLMFYTVLWKLKGKNKRNLWVENFGCYGVFGNNLYYTTSHRCFSLTSPVCSPSTHNWPQVFPLCAQKLIGDCSWRGRRWGPQPRPRRCQFRLWWRAQPGTEPAESWCWPGGNPPWPRLYWSAELKRKEGEEKESQHEQVRTNEVSVWLTSVSLPTLNLTDSKERILVKWKCICSHLMTAVLSNW